MFLWSYIPTVPFMPSMNGVPLGFIHPYFTAELLLTLATFFVWIMAVLIFLDNLRSEGIAFTENITVQNWLILCLILATMIVTVSGIIFYSSPFHFEERTGYVSIPSSNPYAVVNHVGIIFCEVVWIIKGIVEFFQRFSKKRKMNSADF